MPQKETVHIINDPVRVLENAFFSCPLCDDKLEVRISKKEKPYMVCDVCGMQMFVRTKTGIVRLSERLI